MAKNIFEIYEGEDAEAKKLRELNSRLHKQELSKDAPGFFSSLIGYGIGSIFGIFIVALGIAYGTFAHGFVGMKLWEWFIVPVFNIKSISLLQAAGIMLIVRLFTYETAGKDIAKSNNSEKSFKTHLYELWVAMILPWISLLTGYIVHRLL
jgi:hypothetical protein